MYIKFENLLADIVNTAYANLCRFLSFLRGNVAMDNTHRMQVVPCETKQIWRITDGNRSGGRRSRKSNMVRFPRVWYHLVA